MPNFSFLRRPDVPRPLHVLIADDSRVVRQHLIDLLGEIDEVEVVGEAENSHEAVQAAAAHRPEVVVLDIQMPGGSGIGALVRIKELLPETHVIMLTNHADALYRRKCLGEGASHFFDKSTQFAEVGKAVRSLAQA